MGFFKNLFAKPKNQLCAPLTGKAVAINEVSDPTFGEEILGKGIAVIPTVGKVVAPCDGTVDSVFETGHAMSMVADFGAEILIHVGLDTVELKGEHYTVRCASGDKVKKGDLLIEFDVEAISAKGYDVITPMVVCNSDDYTVFDTHVGKNVVPGDVVIELGK